MENVIEKQEGKTRHGARQWLHIMGMMAFLMAAALLVDLMGAPILAAQRSYVSIVRVHGKEAAQMDIPVLSALFGVYEFATDPEDVGIGYKQPVIRKEKTGHLQPVLFTIG
ncbi:hypothetical protein [Acidithiobacillus sp.]